MPQPREYTYVFLRPAKSQQIFYCHRCRNAILQYTGRVSRIIPGDEPSQDDDKVMSAPFVRRCGGTKEDWHCPMYYAFEGFVE